MRVQDLPNHLFISDSRDVAAIKECISTEADNYDCFFVTLANGDYDQVWGMHGTVPFLIREVFQLYPRTGGKSR